MNQPPRGSDFETVRRALLNDPEGDGGVATQDTLDQANAALSRISATIEQQQARIEEDTAAQPKRQAFIDEALARIETLESALRRADQLLADYYQYGAISDAEMRGYISMKRAALNQNPPNPRSEG